jgi:recombination protein RecR
MSIESTGQYRGRYHVLTGVLSPMKGIGPDDLTIGELVQRVDDEKIGEVIIATNLDVEGEATSSYLANLLKPKGIRITRLARGIPVGGSLENADQVTLGMALDGRNVV